MNSTLRPALRTAFPIILFLASVHTVLGLGFRNPDQGARATGQAEAYVAQADDASAIYYNPAGLSQLDGTAVTSGGNIIFPSSRFSAGGGDNAEMNTASILPHLYAASDFGLEQWTFGVGIYIPYGNLADYGDSGRFRYTSTESILAVYSLSPAVSFEINEQLSIGAAANIYYGQVELNRMAPLSVLLANPLLPDRRFNFEGNGAALGATIGLLWKPHVQHSIGVVYRSPFVIDFEGNAIIRQDPTGGFGNSPATAEIVFPQTIAVGYAFYPVEKWKLEFDIEWTNWDTLNNVRLHSPNPGFDAATNPTSNIPFHWQDSFFYEFGTQYQIDEHWVVRAGYLFSENSIPDRTFSASVPDSDRHVMSIGAGYGTERINIDVAYQYSLLMSRDVNGSPDNNFDGTGDADGDWEGEGHAVIITSTLKF